MQLNPAQIERLTPLIDSKPVAVAAAVFLLTSISLLLLLARSYQKRVTQAVEHKDEIKKMLQEERARTEAEAGRELKRENVNSGLLKFFELGAITVRAGKPKRVKLAGGRIVVGWFLDEPVDPLAPEAPTVNTLVEAPAKLPEGEADGGANDDRRTTAGGGGET